MSENLHFRCTSLSYLATVLNELNEYFDIRLKIVYQAFYDLPYEFSTENLFHSLPYTFFIPQYFTIKTYICL